MGLRITRIIAKQTPCDCFRFGPVPLQILFLSLKERVLWVIRIYGRGSAAPTTCHVQQTNCPNSKCQSSRGKTDRGRHEIRTDPTCNQGQVDQHREGNRLGQAGPFALKPQTRQPGPQPSESPNCSHPTGTPKRVFPSIRCWVVFIVTKLLWNCNPRGLPRQGKLLPPFNLETFANLMIGRFRRLDTAFFGCGRPRSPRPAPSIARRARANQFRRKRNNLPMR